MGEHVLILPLLVAVAGLFALNMWLVHSYLRLIARYNELAATIEVEGTETGKP